MCTQIETEYSTYLDIKNIQKDEIDLSYFPFLQYRHEIKWCFIFLCFFILIDFFTWDLPKGMRKSHLESAFWFRLGFSFSHILFCWTWQNISNWSLYRHSYEQISTLISFGWILLISQMYTRYNFYCTLHILVVRRSSFIGSVRIRIYRIGKHKWIFNNMASYNVFVHQKRGEIL